MWIILFRSPITGRIHPIVGDEAYGAREFATQEEAVAYAERRLSGPFRIIDVEDL